TYPLPEAQVDRFFLKLRVPYPARREELDIVDRMATSDPPVEVSKVLAPAELLAYRRVADRVYVDPRAKDYVLDIVRLTREPCPELELGRLIEWGASPRASIYMVMAARARALMDGRTFVIPDDVKAVAPDVLRHRIILTFEAEAEGVRADRIIERVLAYVKVP
ncbi:MAG: MoxR family ATPase, partial [Candidatus Brocadiae bacterium]|nr:MoxR family ATPase [Candidatus Brocadiia bacterium]